MCLGFHESLLPSRASGGPAADGWRAKEQVLTWLMLASSCLRSQRELRNAVARARVPLLTSIFSSYCAWT